MKRIISTLFGLAVLCLFAEAQAVPATVSFTGRLTTSNGPVTGNVNVVFSLFNQATNGTVMWTETRNNLMATNGLVYADLGALTTLDETVLLNSPLFLEISVGGEILSPRLPLQSVPYSIRSEVANSADTLGTIAPGDVVTAVNASGGISANRSGNTVTLTGTAVAGTAPIAVAAGNVSLTTCAANQIYKMNAGGTAWSCQADAAPTASAPLAVTGNNVALTTCGANQVYKMNAGGTAWACAADLDSAPTASAPITVTANNIALTTCAANQIYKMNAGGTAWACAADPTVTAGTGITITAGAISIDSALVARKDAAAGNQAFDSNVLYLDYTNNRVGVNNAAPSNALDVTGNVEATSYTYTSAQTGYFYIAGNSMTPNLDYQDEEWGISSSGYGYIAGGVTAFSIPLSGAVTVPNGVTLTSLFCHYYDNDTTNSLSVSALLYSRPYTSATSTLMGNLSASTTAAGAATTISTVSDTTITGPVINNAANHYFFYVSFSNTANNTSNLRLYGCGVTYTYTSINN